MDICRVISILFFILSSKFFYGFSQNRINQFRLNSIIIPLKIFLQRIKIKYSRIPPRSRKDDGHSAATSFPRHNWTIGTSVQHVHKSPIEYLSSSLVKYGEIANSKAAPYRLVLSYFLFKKYLSNNTSKILHGANMN